LLCCKLRHHGYKPELRFDSQTHEWYVAIRTVAPRDTSGEAPPALPRVAPEGASREIHFHRLTHDPAAELRTVRLRDVSGQLRTVRLHELRAHLRRVTVRDVTGQERTFRLPVRVARATPTPTRPQRTALDHKTDLVHALLALRDSAWLLSGWSRLHLHLWLPHPTQHPRPRRAGVLAPTHAGVRLNPS
jgi:hypothetical protein